MLADLTLVAQIAVKSSVAVLLAGLGEVLAERSGIFNLGQEGMMLAGALAGFAVGAVSGDPWLALGAAMLAGMLLAGLHALFTVGLGADQVLSGLAVALLGSGITGFLGRNWISRPGLRLGAWDVPVLADIPVLGDIFFRQPPLAYAAYVLLPLVCWVLYRTRAGLCIRAAGENAQAADAAGAPVRLALGEYYREKEEIPESLEAAGLSDTLSDGTALRLDSDTMVVEVQTARGTLLMEPAPSGNGLRWTCGAGEGLAEKALPASCK